MQKDADEPLETEECGCDVCGLVDHCLITASGLGPVSYRRCNKCLELGAEMFDLIMLWLVLHQDSPSANSQCLGFISFHNDQYVRWPEIREYFEREHASIVEGVKETMGFDV